MGLKQPYNTSPESDDSEDAEPRPKTLRRIIYGLIFIPNLEAFDDEVDDYRREKKSGDKARIKVARKSLLVAFIMFVIGLVVWIHGHW